jgi:hypothetical protein
MSLINTTYGELDESTLNRTVVLEDRPTEMVVLVRWQLPAGVNDLDAQGPEKFGELVRQDAFPLPKDAGPDVSTTLGMVPFSELERVVELTDAAQELVVAVVWRKDGVLVRRDAHVIKKQLGVEASGVAAALA